MRSYVVLFDPNDADQFLKRVHALGQTAGLPSELVYLKKDFTNGRTFGIYVTEETANRFPQFVSEFPGGEWLDRP
jgi:hypothetical protein